MVTAVPVFEHAPLLAITAVALALVVVATVKPVLYAALDGAPVKVTAGAILLALVVWLAVALL
jgi:hypothetical protein